jgi:putative intracellular protease/amidase
LVTDGAATAGARKKVLIPLPDRDFDTTEVAVAWAGLSAAGHEVVFTTEQGAAAVCDPRLLSGVVFGRLGAAPEAKALYRDMSDAPEFRSPVPWAEVDPEDFDGLLLAGGHAPGMRQHLDSEAVRSKVAAFWALGRPVGAICHGVLVLARTTDVASGRSVIADCSTTCLPKYMERSAFWLTGWKLGRYYRTYPSYVEDEVRAALSDSSKLERGPRVLFRRGTASDDRAAFVVRDGHYLSARWPGDAYLFTSRFVEMLGA